jgi:predicted porin
MTQMKKLLIGTAAISLGVFGIAGQAKAEGLKLNLAGHFKGYVDYLSQDDNVNTGGDAANESVRKIDILRETELHFTGETTLDNGLTVGFHDEVDVDGSDSYDGNDALYNEESYLYMSGAWGRVNFGKEDGAAYLLQVAAPSADANYDCLRQYVSPFRFDFQDDGTGTGTQGLLADIYTASATHLDYDEAVSGHSNKLTYLSPVFSGFQAGISYTPDVANGGGLNGSNDFGNSSNDVDGVLGAAWDLGARWEGQWEQVGIALGGGWSRNMLQDDNATGTADDRTAWDLGVDLNWAAFGIGAAYLHDDLGVDSSAGNADQKTWTVGADYTTGPFKIGASYYRQNQELDGLAASPYAAGGGASLVGLTGDAHSTRWTGGVVYTYGPGMTFRGSVSHLKADVPAAAGDDFSGTTVLLGTQVDF